MADPRIPRLARLLVDYSTAVKPNDKVAIIGMPAAAPLIEAVYERVLEQGPSHICCWICPASKNCFCKKPARPNWRIYRCWTIFRAHKPMY